MAPCSAATVVFRSFTTVEIDTFMTVLSSTITNWASARIDTTDHFFILASVHPSLPQNKIQRHYEDSKRLSLLYSTLVSLWSCVRRRHTVL